MISEKMQKSRLGKAILGGFLSFVMMLTGVTALLGGGQNVYADELDEPVTEAVEETPEVKDEGEESDNKITNELEDEINSSDGAKSCKESLGAVGWLVCPATGTIAKAVDWLYDKIEELLVINPVEMKDGQPIYEIWKYFRGVTNVIFVIFLLVVIYSQITGVGISNYGVKKVLPKMIVVAILINLSFIICSLAVDLSNIVGNSLRGVFENIEMSVMGENFTPGMTVSMSQMYAALGAGGTIGLVAGVVAFESGAIWMLIPTVLGAIVAVATGLITIALRQAVVAILIMIAPLAIVAYMLPNTEKWFTQWRQLLTRMLVFYPAFSLLFGAANLAGFAIIASAKSGFGVVLGVVVQVFPLFFAWKLMRMSGTFLETVNTKLRGFADKPLAANRAWAESHRAATLNRHLAAKDVYTPSLALRQYLENRRIARELETKEDSELSGKRGAAYAASLNYKYDWRTGKLIGASRRGEEAAEKIGRGLKYDRIALRDKNNMNKGLSQIDGMWANNRQKARLDVIDAEIVRNSDDLKFEQARTEKIDYDNAYGFHKRAEDAINAHEDFRHKYVFDDKGKIKLDENGNGVINPGFVKYTMHNIADREAAEARYMAMNEIMDGNIVDTHFAAASAAAAYDTQAKIIMTKFQKYFELTPPTQDVMYRLQDFSKYQKALDQWKSGKPIDPKLKLRAVDNIDAIVSGLRIVNQRGDTDLVRSVVFDLLDPKYGGVELGTHASQALAGLLMFDVGDNDPMLKRFGKFINLETARTFNENERKERMVTFDEYVKGYHMEMNPKTGKMEPFYAKKPMVKLLEGTSLDGIERTAMDNLTDCLKMAYGYDPDNKEKEWDREGWLKKQKEIMTAIEPQFLSSNQKFLSGSEQMASFVKFWTGYAIKPRMKRDDEGNPTKEFELDDKGEQIFDISPVWEGKEFEGFEDEVRAFYEKNLFDFYKDQTTAQVLNTRTDWRAPSAEHLLSMYLNDKNLTDDERSERRRTYGKAKADILAKYGTEELSKEMKDKRDKELDALKTRMVKTQIMKILGETGKLKQIYRTRNNGTAINSKDWFRGWVSLDDEDVLMKEVAKYDKMRKAAREDDGADSPDDDVWELPRIYDEEYALKCQADLENIWDKMKDDPTEVFYGATLEAIHKWFGDSVSLIEHEYGKFYEDHEGMVGPYELRNCLRDLLQDLSKYPDAPSM